MRNPGSEPPGAAYLAAEHRATRIAAATKDSVQHESTVPVLITRVHYFCNYSVLADPVETNRPMRAGCAAGSVAKRTRYSCKISLRC